MTNSKRETRGFLHIKSPTVILRLACILAIFVVATIPLAINGLTGAKYVANAAVDAGARVARWDVKIVSEDIPIEPKDLEPLVLPADVTREDHPLLLFFQGMKGNKHAPTPVFGDAPLKMTIRNDSEVSARVVPTYDVEAESNTYPLDITFYETYTPATGVYSDPIDITGTGAGVLLHPGEDFLVYVLIKNSTFTNLKLGAICVQEN